ncbi:MAG TPA: glycosyltransferase family 2 protein [Rhizomicrobium sp.]|jgi:dolichol-phosphate mannosyltransferase|nr:glycosyltransferase family 2 protein [Rhizomicrobium sp.]
MLKLETKPQAHSTRVTADAPATAPLLSIVVPTFGERDNVEELVRRIGVALPHTAWEIVFVDDDSPDGTAETVRSLARRDPRVRCIHRIGRRGLSSACVEGILASSAPYVAVMDADFQHDEQILPLMLLRLAQGSVDIVVGSRHVEGGSIGNWNNRRAAMSRFAAQLSRLATHVDLQDPMSGYFMMSRDSFMSTARGLSLIGFKILLDIFASAPNPLRYEEIPYHFRGRLSGESKFDSAAMWDYAMLLADKTIGHVLPPRFVAFSIVGALGTLVHMVTLTLLLKALGVDFNLSQASAAVVAMTGNFFLNNALTYRDKRLVGGRMFAGLLTFYAACGIGAAANVGIADYLFVSHHAWWIAGLSGVLIGAVWNYATTSVFTWRGSGRP